MRSQREVRFEQFVRSRRRALVRMATTLTAGDQHLAEDLVQSALTRCYLVAPQLADDAAMFAYVRRAVVNGLIDHYRRPFFRRERVSEVLPDAPAPVLETANDTAHRIVTALALLPIGMRSAVVLRHIEGMSVEEAADALRVSRGTVKSQTARGLNRLRELLADFDDEEPGPGLSYDPERGGARCQI